MLNNKALFLIESDPSNVNYNALKENGYNVSLFFKEINVFFRFIRRMWIYYDFPFVSIWFNNWYKKLGDYDYLIININRLNHGLLSRILNANKDIKIKGWYWNTIDSTNYPINYQTDRVEYYSFDKDDCKKYNLNYNIQYYSLDNLILNQNKEYDVYFVGRDKGRKKEIESFVKTAEKFNLILNINTINGNNIIPYVDVKKELSKSRAVLEINKENQVGFTLRTLESLFFGIKLITNNASIIDSPIYRKENIFIIGKDDYNQLLSFIYSPYNHEVDIYKREYDINKWYSNFFVKENKNESL